MARFSAAKLRKARERLGISAYALAQDAGVPVSTYRDAEHGRREPRVNTVVALAETLGCTVEELCAR